MARAKRNPEDFCPTCGERICDTNDPVEASVSFDEHCKKCRGRSSKKTGVKSGASQGDLMGRTMWERERHLHDIPVGERISAGLEILEEQS